MASNAAPRLSIDYSPDFVLTLQFSHLRQYDEVLPEHYFDVTCRVPHPTGEFTYAGRDICFDLKAFSSFASQLDAIRSGTAGRALLSAVGETIVFSIEHSHRRTIALIRVKEYQADVELTLLSAGFEVDYDLFVNRLFQSTLDFSKDVARDCS